jgi:hypothetical protein
MSVPRPRFCREDGTPFFPVRVDQDFCCPQCRAAFNHRRKLYGLRVIDAALRWRIERPKDALSDLTVIVDRIAEDERERRRKLKETIEENKSALRKGVT